MRLTRIGLNTGCDAGRSGSGLRVGKIVSGGLDGKRGKRAFSQRKFSISMMSDSLRST